MRNLTKLPEHQQGMTLLVAMITLIVLMLMGVGAMVASNTMFKLAGNLQFQNEAKNRAESALIKGETWLLANSTNAGFTTSNSPYYAPGTVVDPIGSWPNAAVSPTTGEQYIVQRITTTKVTPPGYTVCMGCPPTSPPPSYNLFRVTARGTSARGATRYVQSIMQVP